MTKRLQNLFKAFLFALILMATAQKGSAQISSTGKTFYILDEPTTGLHFQDIGHLLDVLNKLVDRGNTVLVIEHNLDMIKVADHIIDIGPEGGEGGGNVLFEGTPEKMSDFKGGFTSKYIKAELA